MMILVPRRNISFRHSRNGVSDDMRKVAGEEEDKEKQFEAGPSSETIESERKELYEEAAASIGAAKLEPPPAEQRRSESINAGGDADAEMKRLRNELREAVEAEEMSKMAMEELSAALRKVAAEARLSSEDAARARAEADELSSGWAEKERALVECIKTVDGELQLARQEIDRLVEAQRGIREENALLRELLKKASSDTGAARESMEAAREESAALRGQLAEKEAALRSLMLEHESLKVSEATATQSFEELKDIMGAMYHTDQSTPGVSPGAFVDAEKDEKAEKAGAPAEHDAVQRRTASSPAIIDEKFDGAADAMHVDPRGTVKKSRASMMRRLSSMWKKS